MRGVALPSRRRQRQIIRNAAKRHGIRPAVLWGLYGAETNFGANTNNSSAGAQGPFQFMPATAASYGINPHNFFHAADAAAKYLATYKDRGFAGMLAAYNAGPAGNPNNPETQAYIPRVRELAATWDPPGGRGGRQRDREGRPGASERSSPGTGAPQAPGRQPAPTSAGVSLAVQSLLARLSEGPQRAPASSLAAPAATAGVTMPGGGLLTPQMSGAPAPSSAGEIQGLIAAARNIAQMPVQVAPRMPTSRRSGGKQASGSGRGSNERGSRGRGGRGGRVPMAGKPSAVAELFWQGPGGINIDEGKVVPQGYVDGHTGHVHFATRNAKVMLAAAKKARELGLHVGENEKWDPVDPVHTSGSFHYRRFPGRKLGQAIDVSGDPGRMKAFARWVARQYGLV
jgi:hypothetical protein